jgi:hypothetical protein
MSMQTTTATKRVLVAAVSAAIMTMIPSAAWAQYQTSNSTGRLLDANNRLGSDGVNDRRAIQGGYSADDVVYGNVTRGRQFRGNASGDPRAFRGNIDQPSADFVRDAGPSAFQRGGTNDPSTAQRWWGDEKGVNAPQGFQQLTPGSPGQFVATISPYRTPGDLSLNAAIPNPMLGLAIPAASDMKVPATEGLATDAANAHKGEAGLETGEEGAEPGATLPQQQLLQRLQLDEKRIREMRQEVKEALTNPQGEQPASPDDLTIAPESPINQPLSSQVNSNLQAKAATGSLNTEQSLQQKLLTAQASAARTSDQYAEMQNRLQRFKQRQGMSDEEANRQFMKEWNQSQEAQKTAAAERDKQQQQQQLQARNAEGANPTATPKSRDVETVPQATGPDRAHIVSKLQQDAQDKTAGPLPPQPQVVMKVTSFADGVKATRLKELISHAEQRMREGKFTQALDDYDAASMVMPNNPLIMMGRAVAELGAGYYARAQVHLEQVLSADPALLMARYDLKTFYGEDRLRYLTGDLKDLAQVEQRQSRPMFLLAFIAYSTENEQRAADYLNLAEQRGGNKDFYNKLREFWKLPAATQAPAAVPAAKPAGK